MMCEKKSNTPATPLNDAHPGGYFFVQHQEVNQPHSHRIAIRLAAVLICTCLRSRSLYADHQPDRRRIDEALGSRERWCRTTARLGPVDYLDDGQEKQAKVLQLDEVVADLLLLFRFEKTASCNPDGHGGAGVCGGTLRGGDVATMVEVERFLHQPWFSSRRHPLSGSEGSVARLVHKLMGENITGKNLWQE